MSHPEITEKELRVIDEVSKDANLTQRDISRKVGISLGMVNIILKKLAKKGYIKARQLNGKRIQYILTPGGFAEKTKKSYHYILRTITRLRQMKKKIQKIILIEYKKGQREFIILGDGELADIVEISLRSLNKPDIRYKRIAREQEISNKEATILAVNPKPGQKKETRHLDILASITELK
ncbi:MAG: winged helix-turn-helix transcriptional regulator [Candidatus Aerophobetes bacterium]|nr:winged helix-turn-helix transcriptional regulator [Candidatus Aerophobetes bacterium]